VRVRACLCVRVCASVCVPLQQSLEMRGIPLLGCLNLLLSHPQSVRMSRCEPRFCRAQPKNAAVPPSTPTIVCARMVVQTEHGGGQEVHANITTPQAYMTALMLYASPDYKGTSLFSVELTSDGSKIRYVPLSGCFFL